MDEAHSSQSGESTKSLKAVLASGSLEEAEAEEAGVETDDQRAIFLLFGDLIGLVRTVRTVRTVASPTSPRFNARFFLSMVLLIHGTGIGLRQVPSRPAIRRRARPNSIRSAPRRATIDKPNGKPSSSARGRLICGNPPRPETHSRHMA